MSCPATPHIFYFRSSSFCHPTGNGQTEEVFHCIEITYWHVGRLGGDQCCTTMLLFSPILFNNSIVNEFLFQFKLSCSARIINDRENIQRIWHFSKTLPYRSHTCYTFLRFGYVMLCFFIYNLNEKPGIPSKPRKVSITWRISAGILQVNWSLFVFNAAGNASIYKLCRVFWFELKQ